MRKEMKIKSGGTAGALFGVHFGLMMSCCSAAIQVCVEMI